MNLAVKNGEMTGGGWKMAEKQDEGGVSYHIPEKETSTKPARLERPATPNDKASGWIVPT